MQIELLRHHIDQLDQTLLVILAKRLKLVTKVNTLKFQKGLPFILQNREDGILFNRRLEAIKLGVSPDLIEDILRRVIHESYITNYF